MTAFDKDNLQIIFSSLVNWWLHRDGYGNNITKLTKGLVAATLDVYEVRVRVGDDSQAGSLLFSATGD
jgi:hypothetical protein